MKGEGDLKWSFLLGDLFIRVSYVKLLISTRDFVYVKRFLFLLEAFGQRHLLLILKLYFFYNKFSDKLYAFLEHPML